MTKEPTEVACSLPFAPLYARRTGTLPPGPRPEAVRKAGSQGTVRGRSGSESGSRFHAANCSDRGESSYTATGRPPDSDAEAPGRTTAKNFENLNRFSASMSIVKKLRNLIVLFVIIVGTAHGEEVTPRQVIDRFLEAESRLEAEFQNYTYSQTIIFQELSDWGSVRGERVVEYDIYFDTAGERQHRKTRDRGRMPNIQVTKHDLDDAVSRQPFMLTTETAVEYEIDYVGKELIDELNTYVFDVEPKSLKKGKRYFRGRIYVDDVDFLIVMTSGKIVPDHGNNKYPAFETIRQEIEEGIWFPTWTGADDTLHFRNGSQRIKMVITFEDFKRFEVDTTITFDSEEPIPPDR